MPFPIIVQSKSRVMKEHVRAIQRQGISQKDKKAELFEWFHSTAMGMLVYIYLDLFQNLSTLLYVCNIHLFTFQQKVEQSKNTFVI